MRERERETYEVMIADFKNPRKIIARQLGYTEERNNIFLLLSRNTKYFI